MFCHDITVVLAFDDAYARYGFAVLRSVLENAAPNTHFSFHVLHENLNHDWQKKGITLFTTPRSCITFMDVGEHFKDKTLSEKDHFTRAIYYRLCIPHLFQTCDCVVYLDSDLIVRADLATLVAAMDKSKAIGAVRDILRKMSRTWNDRAPAEYDGMPQLAYEREILKLDDPDRYFQSGVLVFNMSRITEQHVRQCLSMMEQPLWLPDQDILNAVFQHDLCLLDERWNLAVTPPAWGPPPESNPNLPPEWQEKHASALTHPCIVHYPGTPKPWNNGMQPMSDLFLTTLHDIDTQLAALEEGTTPSRTSLQKQNMDHKNAIPVVISFDQHYARYGFTVLQSILNTAPSEKTFAFFILHEGVSGSAQDIAQQMFTTGRSTLTFLDMRPLFADMTLPTRWHFARQTYYRLRIPELFAGYRYVIYLDSDIVIKKDISLILEDMDPASPIGAAKDILRKAPLEQRHRSPHDCRGPYGEDFGNMEAEHYMRQALGMRHPDDYFQAGVVIFNIPQIRAEDCTQALAMIPQNLWMQDQDILNAVFQERVCFLNPRWNVLCGNEALALAQHLPESWKHLYDDIRKDPYILHYGGSAKPWNTPDGDFSEDFNSVLQQVNRQIHKITAFRP